MSRNEPTTSTKPNVLFFQVDNLGYGELGCYGGGILRGARTERIDGFASEGLKLLNYAPEAQCTPSRSALMTGRYSVRSGNHTVALAGSEGSGLVRWERTLSDVFADAGYATMCMGKWHIGDGAGRWPTDHGFDEWYGPPHSYDESMWEDDPWYDLARDPVAYLLDASKGQPPRRAERLTLEARVNVDVEYKMRAIRFIEDSVRARRPFLLYFNHSMLHMPVIPREEYRGKSGNGDWADSLLELDGDFGDLLDTIDASGLRDNTIVVFAGDNGPEENILHRGTAGYWAGSYFTGMEASLRTPCIIRWPAKIPAGRDSNEIVHVTDMFTTLIAMAGLKAPDDRVIDGVDQLPFFAGTQDHSNRDGFIFWNGGRMYGVKWRHFKLVMVEQKYLYDAAPPLGVFRIVNLLTDPKEREPANPRFLHTWTMAHFGRLLKEFDESVKREPPIPPGAPLDFAPISKAHA
jgi:arylsulfatase